MINTENIDVWKIEKLIKSNINQKLNTVVEDKII